MSAVSRRDLFRALLGRPRPEETEPSLPAKTEDQIALILDRFCLAFQGGFCSICSEHCPEDGAILVTQGKPQVVADVCTGCQKCYDVCPAPKKAIFMVSRQPRQGMIANSGNENQTQE